MSFVVKKKFGERLQFIEPSPGVYKLLLGDTSCCCCPDCELGGIPDSVTLEVLGFQDVECDLFVECGCASSNGSFYPYTLPTSRFHYCSVQNGSWNLNERELPGPGDSFNVAYNLTIVDPLNCSSRGTLVAEDEECCVPDPIPEGLPFDCYDPEGPRLAGHCYVVRWYLWRVRVELYCDGDFLIWLPFLQHQFFFFDNDVCSLPGSAAADSVCSWSALEPSVMTIEDFCNGEWGEFDALQRKCTSSLFGGITFKLRNNDIPIP